MKKSICFLLAAVLLFTAFGGYAEPKSWIAMRVSNCREWVSLRLNPSTSSRRLAKVPLNTVLYGCEEAEHGFIFCVYGEKSGYIQAQYLTEVDPFSALTDTPSVSRMQDFGKTIADFAAGTAGEYRVLVQRIETPSCNLMAAAVYDRSGNYVSGLRTATEEIGQITALYAFPGGTETERHLIWADGKTMSAYLPGPEMVQNRLWSVDWNAGGLSWGVATEGTLFITGYFSGSLTCLSVSGETRWKASPSNPETCWPYQVTVKDQTVEVAYEESGRHDGTGSVITYNSATGEELDTRIMDGRGETKEVRIRVTSGKKAKPEACHVFSASEEEPVSRVLFTPEAPVANFRILDLNLKDFINDQALFETKTLYTLDLLEPQKPLLVYMTFFGDIPNNGFAYTDGAGLDHYFSVELSGKNGSLQATEFNPAP